MNFMEISEKIQEKMVEWCWDRNNIAVQLNVRRKQWKIKVREREREGESFRNSNYLDEQQHDRSTIKCFDHLWKTRYLLHCIRSIRWYLAFTCESSGALWMSIMLLGFNSRKDFHSIVMDFNDDNFPSLHYS